MADWRKLFSAPSNHSLEYFPPVLRENATPLVNPPDQVFSEGFDEWKNSIVAQFLGKPPNFILLQRTLSKLWKKRGSVKITLVGPNLYIFQFESDAACTWILENGPWHVQHVPMILRKWEPNLGLIDFNMEKLPLWFHLHYVSLVLYNRKGISYLASAIVIPLYMDSITGSKKRLAYANVCVEVSAAIDPPDEIEVTLKDGTTTTVGVSIPWRPAVCRSCNTFGHVDKVWTKAKENKPKTAKVWVPKTVKLNESVELENHSSSTPIKEQGICSPITNAPSLEVALYSDTLKEKTSGICSLKKDDLTLSLEAHCNEALIGKSPGSPLIGQNSPLNCINVVTKQISFAKVNESNLVGANKPEKGICSPNILGKGICSPFVSDKSIVKSAKSVGRNSAQNKQKMIGSSKNIYAILCEENPLNEPDRNENLDTESIELENHSSSTSIKEQTSGICSLRKDDLTLSVEAHSIEALIGKSPGICSPLIGETSLIGCNNAPTKQISGICIGKSATKPVGKKSAHNNQKPIGSSKNKYTTLCEEEYSNDTDEDDNLEDLPNVDPSKTVWSQLIENANFAPKKTRAAAREAANVWLDLKPKKTKIVAKGTKKGPPLGQNLTPCQFTRSVWNSTISSIIIEKYTFYFFYRLYSLS